MSDESSTDRTPAPRRARAGLAGLAIVFALAALILGGWAAWQVSRMLRTTDFINAHNMQLTARLDAVQRNADNANAQQQALERRLTDVESDGRALRDNVQDLDQRVRNLETALANVSDQHLSGHDALLLDDTEFLLRAGQQRYVLFHDADGALRAYTLAAQALAQVTDPAFTPVRAGVANERAALVAATPPSRQQALAALNTLRTQLPALPMATPEVGAGSTSQTGAWSRLWRAFGGILRIERDQSTPLPAADARFARELAALDLAQAQAALLANDDDGYRAALQRVDATLGAHFDGHDAAVRSARANVRELLAAHPAHPAPTLGGALAQLRDLRATHALQSIAPAAATSGGIRKP